MVKSTSSNVNVAPTLRLADAVISNAKSLFERRFELRSGSQRILRKHALRRHLKLIGRDQSWFDSLSKADRNGVWSDALIAVGSSVCSCGSKTVYKTVMGRKKTVRNKKTGKESSFNEHYGLSSCNSKHACTTCAIQKEAEASKDIAKILRVAQSKGHAPRMLTFTSPHYANMSLYDCRKKMDAAWREFNKVVHRVLLLRNSDYQGCVRSTEVVRTYSNGWHYHFHVLAILNEVDCEELHDALLPLWRKACQKVGLLSLVSEQSIDNFNEYALRVSPADADAAAYMTKNKFDALSFDEQVDVMKSRRKANASMTSELVSNSTKQGRVRVIGDVAMQPFEILATALQGGEDAWYYEELWYEFVTSMKGVRKLTISRALQAYLEEIEEDQDDDEEMIGSHVFYILNDTIFKAGYQNTIDRVMAGGPSFQERFNAACEEYLETGQLDQVVKVLEEDTKARFIVVDGCIHSLERVKAGFNRREHYAFEKVQIEVLNESGKFPDGYEVAA